MWLNNRCRNQGFLKNFKCFYTIIIKNKWDIFLQEISERPRSFREVFNKSPIETNMTKETSYTFDIFRTWHFLNSINLSFINFNTSFRNFMPKDYTFINHKMALLPIQDKISFFTSLQNSIKVAQAIIHENLNNLFTKVREYSSHTSLKGSRCIT